MKKYLTIAGALIFAYIIVKIMTPQVFIQNSPTLDPQFIANIKDLPTLLKKNGNNVVLLATNIIRGIKVGVPSDKPMIQNALIGLTNDQIPEGLKFNQFVKGVAAAEDEATGKKYIKMSAGTKYVKTGETIPVTIDGKTYNVPKIEIVN